MPNQRDPLFELHIRPMMRLLDREKMLSIAGFDLWDYEDVKAEAKDILDHLKLDMPPEHAGGPWPKEWIKLFERWTKTGFKRLELGKPDDSGYEIQNNRTRVTIRATGVLPDEGYRYWLDLEPTDSTTRKYVFYFQPPQEPIGNPNPFQMRERFRAAATLNRIVITDANGVHEYPLSSSIA